MSAEPLDSVYLTEEEYLELEKRSPIKHEYLGGIVYAMGGGTASHDVLLNNIVILVSPQLTQPGCRIMGPEYALRLPAQLPGAKSYYYYPDKMISCDLDDRQPLWMERPSVIFEVASESTRQIDEREKRAAYLQLPTLQAYIRLEQDEALADVDYRSPKGWQQMQVRGLNATIVLTSPPLDLPMRDLYRDVQIAEG